MLESISITIEAELEGAFHILGPGRTSALIDRPIELDTDGYPLMPASSIRGRTRTQMERLLPAFGESVCTPPLPQNMCPHHKWDTSVPSGGFCRACQIFGSPGRPSAIRFGDLALIQEMRSNPLVFRQERMSVTISRRLGTAQEHKLFSTETTTAFYGDRPLRFQGTLRGRLEPENVGWLLASLSMVEHIGGSKARGLGKISIRCIEVAWWREGEWFVVNPLDLIEGALR